MSIYEHTEYDHTLLNEVVENYVLLPEVLDQPLALQDFNRKVENWRKGIYKLVVVGEIKKANHHS